MDRYAHPLTRLTIIVRRLPSAGEIAGPELETPPSASHNCGGKRRDRPSARPVAGEINRARHSRHHPKEPTPMKRLARYFVPCTLLFACLLAWDVVPSLAAAAKPKQPTKNEKVDKNQKATEDEKAAGDEKAAKTKKATKEREAGQGRRRNIEVQGTRQGRGIARDGEIGQDRSGEAGRGRRVRRRGDARSEARAHHDRGRTQGASSRRGRRPKSPSGPNSGVPSRWSRRSSTAAG